MSSDITTKIDKWKNQLLNLSKSNRLINCRIGGRNSLQIVSPSLDRILDSVLDGKTMQFSWKKDLIVKVEAEERQRYPIEKLSPLLGKKDILTPLTDEELNVKLKRKAADAKTSLEEHGVNILYLGFEFLKWFESASSDDALLSPLYLVPVRLYQTSPGSPWQIIRLEDEAMCNHSLWERMKQDFRLTLPQLQSAEDEKMAEDKKISPSKDFGEFLESIQAAIPQSPDFARWEIQPHVVLDSFNFQKVAMFQDMKQNKERIAENVLCRILAGDESASDLLQREPSVTAKELDEKVRPLDTFSVLDSDSSQQEAIQAVLRGNNLVLDGPPGTGKSQTIANIIAEVLAKGKKILFVSEKAAAIDVVKRRLDNVNLGDFCLDCHALLKKNAAGKKGMVGELIRCLDLGEESTSNQTDELNDLYFLRSELNKYVQFLHEPVSKLQDAKTPFLIHGYYLKYQDTKKFRSQISNPLSMVSSQFDAIKACFEVIAQNPVTENHATHPWRGCRLTNVTFDLPEIKDDFTELAPILADCDSAVNILNENHLMNRTTTYNSLHDSLQKILPLFTSAIDEYVTIPESWFVMQPEIISGLLQRLTDLIKKHQTLREEYKNITNEINLKNSFDVYFANPSIFEAEFASLKSCETTESIANRLKKQFSINLFQEKESLSQVLDQLDVISDKIDRILSFSLPPAISAECDISQLSLQKLFDIVEWGYAVQTLPKILPNWQDRSLDTKIENCLTACQEYIEKMKFYQEKVSHLSSLALISDEYDTTVKKVRLFDNILKRVFGMISGSFKKWKTDISDLYQNSLPADYQIVQDMNNLQMYHYWKQKMTTLESENQEHCHIAGGIETYNQTVKLRSEMERLFTNHVVQSLLQSLADGEITIFFSEAGDIRDLLNELFAEIESVSQIFIIDRVTQSELFKNVTFERCIQFIDVMKNKINNRLHNLTHIFVIFPNQELTNTDFIKQIRKLEFFFKKLGNLKSEKDSLVNEFPSEPDFDNSELLKTQIESYQCFCSIFKGKITERNRRILTSKECYEKIHEQITVVHNLYKSQKNKKLWKKVSDCFSLDETVSSGIVLSKSTIQELSLWLYAQIANINLLNDWAKYKNSTDQLKNAGLNQLVDEMEEGTIRPHELKEAFLARFYYDCLRAAHYQLPVLYNFNIDKHSQTIGTFREYDEKSYRKANQRVRHILLKSRRDIPRDAPPSTDVGILRGQFNRKRNLMSIRQLFSKIHDLILRLKPCVMMSPLTVSTYLQNVTKKFDLVIFDEASQILPHDAITVIYRGNQVVIAGDQKQLPPTTFFTKLGNENETDDNDDENETDNINDYESILDVFAAKLPRKRLRWHYRSRREPLIAFSNQKIYGNELVTFPGSIDEKNNPAIKFEFVPDGRWKSGNNGRFNQIEAARTAKLIMQFFREHSDKSLGVIALNQRHQQAILDEIDKLRRDNPKMEKFFNDEDNSGSNQEPFFVKNLENVQGDERDYIFLCIGYGKDEVTGKMPMRFGPINTDVADIGRRRLNVAITRAKYGITVISSIKYSDIDLKRSKKSGVEMLQDYLKFAETGNLEVSRPTGGEADSPFEIEVTKALEKEGFEVHTQVGCSGYRIDIALIDKESPGRYVLGVECDGATYHSSATARDRDRLRQQILEGLGWKIHRIWSTDWIKNPKQQIEKVKEAFNSAKIQQEIERPTPTCSQPKEPPVVVTPCKDPFAPKYNYNNIEEISVSLIRNEILYVLRIASMIEDDLLKTVAKIFGFERVGPRIRQILTKQLQVLQKNHSIDIGTDARLFVKLYI